MPGSLFSGVRRDDAAKCRRAGLLAGQRDRRGHAGLIAVHPGGVSAAARILDEARVAGAEDVLGPVAQPDLELARQDDDELAAWSRMPVQRPADGVLAERD